MGDPVDKDTSKTVYKWTDWIGWVSLKEAFRIALRLRMVIVAPASHPERPDAK